MSEESVFEEDFSKPHVYRQWVDSQDVGNTCCLRDRRDPFHIPPQPLSIDDEVTCPNCDLTFYCGDLVALTAERDEAVDAYGLWRDNWNTELHNQITDLTAEVERLRGAMREILALEDRGSDAAASIRFHDARRIAKDALTPTPEKLFWCKVHNVHPRECGWHTA